MGNEPTMADVGERSKVPKPAVIERWRCAYCLKLPLDPIELLQCQHTFCACCLLEHAHTTAIEKDGDRRLTCPVCQVTTINLCTAKVGVTDGCDTMALARSLDPAGRQLGVNWQVRQMLLDLPSRNSACTCQSIGVQKSTRAHRLECPSYRRCPLCWRWYTNGHEHDDCRYAAVNCDDCGQSMTLAEYENVHFEHFRCPAMRECCERWFRLEEYERHLLSSSDLSDAFDNGKISLHHGPHGYYAVDVPEPSQSVHDDGDDDDDDGDATHRNDDEQDDDEDGDDEEDDGDGMMTIECPNRLVRCPFDCGRWITQAQKELHWLPDSDAIVADPLFVCRQDLVRCMYCGEIFTHEGYRTCRHDLHCPNRAIPCTQCGVWVEAAEIDRSQWSHRDPCNWCCANPRRLPCFCGTDIMNGWAEMYRHLASGNCTIVQNARMNAIGITRQLRQEHQAIVVGPNLSQPAVEWLLPKFPVRHFVLDTRTFPIAFSFRRPVDFFMPPSDQGYAMWAFVSTFGPLLLFGAGAAAAAADELWLGLETSDRQFRWAFRLARTSIRTIVLQGARGTVELDVSDTSPSSAATALQCVIFRRDMSSKLFFPIHWVHGPHAAISGHLRWYLTSLDPVVRECLHRWGSSG